MKKFMVWTIILIGVGVLIFFGAVFARDFFSKTTVGSDVMIEKVLPMPEEPFQKVSVHRGIQVVLLEDKTPQIKIQANDNLMDFVRVNSLEGRLEVTIDNELKKVANVQVKVELPNLGNLQGLKATSNAKLSADHALQADEMSLNASSGAEIKMAVKARECEMETTSGATALVAVKAQTLKIEATSSGDIVAQCEGECVEVDASSGADVELELKDYQTCEGNATSGADIRLKGTCKEVNVEASSGAEIDASELKAQEVKSEASSGGSISVYPIQSLTAEASSGGSVRYLCRPKQLKSLSSFGGEVEQRKF